jgi:hypothetical protein
MLADIYQFTVEAVDGGAAEDDRFSMTLHGADLMFDGHTFRLKGVSGDWSLFSVHL